MRLNGDELLRRMLLEDPIAREQWEAYQKVNNDPRITGLGRFLRRTSLDELPQLWNVLIGDMSLVGPRPCMPDQKTLYGSSWAHYCQVRPGLTGLWQVSGRNQLTYERRVQLDAQYVSEWSFSLDLRILLKTFSVVLTGHGAK